MAMAKLSLLILVAAFLAGSGTTKGDCEYQLKVKTEEWNGDGTEAFVEFWLFGDSQGGGGPIVTHEEDADGAKFGGGRTGEFSFTDTKCIRPCRIVLSIDQSRLRERSSWLCQSVDVTVSGGISPYSKSFHVNQFVESDSPVEIDECDGAAAGLIA